MGTEDAKSQIVIELYEEYLADINNYKYGTASLEDFIEWIKER
jgi:hypothetical protein